MLQKTRVIILHQIKYSDSGIIVQTYTRDFGRQSILVRGVRSSKSGKHNALFQPMFILDTVFYRKESRSVQTMKEYSVSYAPSDIYSEIKKSTVAVFLGEFLMSVLKEESPHIELFRFIEDSIKYFDRLREGYANFHIAFLIGLSSFLGFEPGRRIVPEDRYFDLKNGAFVRLPPPHGDFAEKNISDVLAAFFSTSFGNTGKVPLSGSLRNEVLETLIKYYSIHLPGLRKINSLEVLKEIFG
ncbi:MAG: DNA repair protein RecO [Bacteroidota bacterium]|nr:DNA repair protein RecO [Bacteroidota bacterium]